jgi:hypothetical protein
LPLTGNPVKVAVADGPAVVLRCAANDPVHVAAAGLQPAGPAGAVVRRVGCGAGRAGAVVWRAGCHARSADGRFAGFAADEKTRPIDEKSRPTGDTCREPDGTRTCASHSRMPPARFAPASLWRTNLLAGRVLGSFSRRRLCAAQRPISSLRPKPTGSGGS